MKNMKQVLLGLQHVIADIIAKDGETLSTMKKMWVEVSFLNLHPMQMHWNQVIVGIASRYMQMSC